MITETEICIYREIYYETVKPMLIAGKSQDEIEVGVKYICEEYGMEVERYKAISIMDMMQRISERTGGSKVGIRTSDGEILPIPKGLPILRCPRRTEDPIKIS